MLVDIRGYPNYQISTNGTVYSKKRNLFLKPFKDGWGYSEVTLSSEGIQVNKHIHRLVAETFIPNPLNKSEVNHIDGNKNNNDVTNLEWVTGRENKIHAFRIGLNDRSSYNAGRPKRKVILSENGMTFNSITECADYLHCTHTAVINCLNNKSKKCKGYTINCIE